MMQGPSPRVAFINLARDRDRAQALTKAFAGCRHAPERFDAVDWRALDAERQATYYSAAVNAQHYFRPLTAGECGCYASHVEAWRQLLSSSDDCLVVLEDDVEPGTGFDDAIDAIARMAGPWDMVKLVGRDKEKLTRSRPLTDQHALVQYRRVPSLTGAYVISRRGAEKLLTHRVPFGRPIDIDIRWWWEVELVVLGAVPYPVRLAPSSLISTIGQREPRATLRARWAKLSFKLAYNWQQWGQGGQMARVWQALKG